MKHYLLLAGLFACVLSASAQKVGTKPNVINQGVTTMTQTDKTKWLGDKPRYLTNEMDVSRTDMHKPSRSIVVKNEKWLNNKIVWTDANGIVFRSTEIEYTDFGNPQKETINYYDEGKLVGCQIYTYEYDNKHQNTKETLSQLVEMPNTFGIVYDKEWEYNELGLNTSYSEKNYNFRTDNSVESGRRNITEYDNNSNQTLYETYKFDNNEWVPIQREEFGWDGYYMYMHLTLSDWNNVSKKWTTGQKVVRENVYNGKPCVNSGLYDWDADMQQWSVSSEEIVEFDDYGRQILSSRITSVNEGYDGYRWTEEFTSPEYSTLKHYVWDNVQNGWVLDWYRNKQYDENGNLANTSTYTSDNALNNRTEYTWEKYNIGTDVYPDCYIVGEASEWQFENRNVGKDMGKGIVVWNDVTIKNGEMFKFASDDWMTFDWGTAYDGEYIPFDQPVQLTNKGQNIKLDMEGTEMTFKSISINVLTGVVAFETYPTSVGSPEAKRVNIFANNGKIVVQNAKDVKVYSASGELISTAAVTPVEKGLYVVKAGGKTVKLNVN